MGRDRAMTEQTNPNEILSLTTNIVAAHVANNPVAVNDLPQLIREVFQALASVGGLGEGEAERHIIGWNQRKHGVS